MEKPNYFYQSIQASKHPKIKALEEKFGDAGYAGYFITIEILAAHDGSISIDEFNSEIEKSFVGSKYQDDIQKVIEYGFELDLFDEDLYKNKKILEAKDHDGIFLYADEYEREID